MSLNWRHGQGATEYLVIFAIMLILALVAASLLGFYPGTVSDSQLAENDLYWRNAKPLAISDVIAYPSLGFGPGFSDVAMTVRNVGEYPLTLTKVFGKNASGAERSTPYYNDESGVFQPLNSITIMPGKSVCFGHFYGVGITTGNCPKRSLALAAIPNPFATFGGTLACASDGKGIAKSIDFGFEYNETIGGARITKRQAGQLLLARCQAG